MAYFIIKIIYLVFALQVFVRSNIYDEEYQKDNFTFYEVTAFNVRERALLYSIHIKNDSVSFMNGVTNEAALPMDVIVNNCCTESFENKLNTLDIQYNSAPIRPYALKLKTDNNITEITSEFYTFEAISDWIDLKLKRHSIFLQRIPIALTYEKRYLYLLKISTGKKKTAVFIVAGEEGRDWLSPAIILNLIEKILELKYFHTLLEYHDFYFLPIFNPDGYSFSMTEDRFWSKNRKEFFPEKKCTGQRTAVGVNVDRNWYLARSNTYSTESECNSVYQGYKPTSEAETKALYYVLNLLSVKLLAYINVKGSDNLITIPYGYTTDTSNNHALMMEILSSVCEKLKAEYNTTFFVGNAAKFLYNSSGTSADWVKKQLNVPIVLTVYLQYKNSYLPHPSHVEPLTQQLSTIVRETLMIATDIYGPLYNSQVKLGAPAAIALIFYVIY